MGNLDITQRNSLERSTLAGNDSLRRGSEKGSAIYAIIALLVGGALGYAAISAIESSWEWVVLGIIVLTMIGFMIAVSPNRRG